MCRENKHLINDDLKDYKIWCFHGQPTLTLVCSDRQGELKEDFFDNEWTHLPIKRPNHANAARNIPEPNCFALMKLLAGKLAESLDFARVDFYEINGKVYFGEITLFPADGFVPFEPDEWDNRLGQLLCLKSISK